MNHLCRTGVFLAVCFLSGCITTPQEAVVAPVHQALTKGDTSELERALKSRKQLLALNDYGETPLLYTIKHGQPAFVDRLLSKGADVNAPNPRTGETPLIAAVISGDREMLKEIMAHGAQLDQGDNEGLTPLVWACRKGDLEAVRALLGAADQGKAASSPETVLAAASYGHDGVLEYLLSLGAPVDARSPQEETPLILAARFGHEKTVRLLLSKGAGKNALDKNGASALTWAARLGRVGIVKALLEQNVAVDPIDKTEQTPLSHAVRLGHTEVVRELVAKGANLNREMKEGGNLMYEAAFQDGIARSLHQAGAGIEKILDRQTTSLEAAVRYLWMAQFYEKQLVQNAGNASLDRDRAVRCYEWAGEFFNKASEEYERTAKEIRSAERWAIVGMLFLSAAADTAASMQAQTKAKQMAEIGALGNANRHGTGLQGYYSALSARKSAIPYAAYGQTPIGASLGGVVPPSKAIDRSPTAYQAEAKKCHKSAEGCRAAAACYGKDHGFSAALRACLREAHGKIRHLGADPI